MSWPRIALLSSGDTRNRMAWSGTPFYMGQALERHCGQVVHLGPVRPMVETVAEVRNRFTRRFLNNDFPYYHSPALSREYGKIFRKRLHQAGSIDVIFAPAGSTQIAFLETDIPIIYASDATFHLMQGYYSTFSNLSIRYAAAANLIERKALNRAKIVTFPSDWAAQSAIDDYSIGPEKVAIIPWGANMDIVPGQGVLQLIKKDTTQCNLLFLGVDWERKGGPIAVEVTKILRERGIDATLTVCGCTPPGSLNAHWLRVFPRLDKNDPSQQLMLSNLLLEANFMLLPSQAECFGIAFCEASAHGTPSIASATGGVGSAVSHGKSGFLLPLDANAESYADVILGAWFDPGKYHRLVEETYAHYETTVNWDTWGLEMTKIISDILSKNASL